MIHQPFGTCLHASNASFTPRSGQAGAAAQLGAVHVANQHVQEHTQRSHELNVQHVMYSATGHHPTSAPTLAQP